MVNGQCKHALIHIALPVQKYLHFKFQILDQDTKIARGQDSILLSDHLGPP